MATKPRLTIVKSLARKPLFLIPSLLLTASALGALAGCATVDHPVAKVPKTTVVQSIPRPLNHPLVDTSSLTPTRPTLAPKATALSSKPLPSTGPKTTPSPTLAPHQVVAPPSVPRTVRNHLSGPYGLNTSVGTYTDCTGNSELPQTIAVIDVCRTGTLMFVGHNRGVFTPLLSYVVGDRITWIDQNGRILHLRVVAVRNVSSSVFPPVLGTYEFQTCLYSTATSSLDRDLDAVVA